MHWPGRKLCTCFFLGHVSTWLVNGIKWRNSDIRDEKREMMGLHGWEQGTLVLPEVHCWLNVLHPMKLKMNWSGWKITFPSSSLAKSCTGTMWGSGGLSKGLNRLLQSRKVVKATHIQLHLAAALCQNVTSQGLWPPSATMPLLIVLTWSPAWLTTTNSSFWG